MSARKITVVRKNTSARTAFPLCLLLGFFFLSFPLWVLVGLGFDCVDLPVGRFHPSGLLSILPLERYQEVLGIDFVPEGFEWSVFS